MRQRSFLVVLLVLLVGLVSVGAWWLSRETPARAAPIEPLVPTIATPVAPPPRAASDDRVGLKEVVYASLDTTVVFPLVMELELARADDQPRAEGVAPLGSGATARFKGSILDDKGAGVRAQIRFEHGPNAGRVLTCDTDGNFGATDLYPGLAIYRVSGPGIVGSQREVRLRQERESLEHIGYGRPAIVHGEVFGRDGKKLPGVKVTLDGQVAETDAEGHFVFPRMTSGNSLLTLELDGYAAQRELVNVAAATTIETGRLKFSLQPAARLQVTIESTLNSGEEAQLFVLPSNMAGQRTFPWHTKNPVKIWPGGTAMIEDLPSGSVSLRLFHAGAVAKPTSTTVELTAGETTQTSFQLEPATVVTGIVTDNGQPVEGALVRLEAPDRSSATLSLFDESNSMFLESEVLPDFPVALQETRSSRTGGFSLSANVAYAQVRYLTALSADGRRRAHAVLKGGETKVELALAAPTGGDGTLIVQMDGRYQPLPVKVVVNGVPRDPFFVPGGQDLRIEGLVRGVWKLNARWNTDSLAQAVEVQVRNEVAIPLTLPDGAIHGQDLETRKRAGHQ